MKYEVLKDFEDSDVKIDDGDGTKRPLKKAAGEVFTPAEIGYPAGRIDRLTSNGTLRLMGRGEVLGVHSDQP